MREFKQVQANQFDVSFSWLASANIKFQIFVVFIEFISLLTLKSTNTESLAEVYVI